MWVKVSNKGRRDLLLGVCYRPDVSDKTTVPLLRESLDKYSTKYEIILGGDFNFPGFQWKDHELKPNTSYINLHEDFTDVLNTYGLDQLVTDPTRLTNTLDLVITNNPQKISRSKVIPGISDHKAITI